LPTTPDLICYLAIFLTGMFAGIYRSLKK
jgi:hypothetical protein